MMDFIPVLLKIHGETGLMEKFTYLLKLVSVHSGIVLVGLLMLHTVIYKYNYEGIKMFQLPY